MEGFAQQTTSSMASFFISSSMASTLQEKDVKDPARIIVEEEEGSEEEEGKEEGNEEVEEEEDLDLLPEGWIPIRHKKENKVFYYHQQSQTITWSRPYTFNYLQQILQTHVPSKPRKRRPTKPRGIQQESIGKQENVAEVKTKPRDREVEKVKEMLKEIKVEENEVGEAKTRVLLRLAGTNEAAYFLISDKLKTLATLKKALSDRYSKVLTPSCKKILLVKRSSGEILELGENLPEIFEGDRLEVYIKGNWSPSKEGKNEAMLLSEYCENVLQSKPEYQESTTDAAQAGFRSMVVIAGKGYASATGGTKKQARQKAAAKTLSILLPDHCQDHQHRGGIANLSMLDSLLVQVVSHSELPPPSTLQIPSLAASLQALTRPQTYFRTPVPPAQSEEEARVQFRIEFPEIHTWGQVARYLIEVEESLVQPRDQASTVESAKSPLELAKLAKPNRPNQALLDKLKEEMMKLS